MKRITCSIVLSGVLLTLSGCYSASPQLIRGDYYMTGDTNCRTWRTRGSGFIDCYNSEGKATGYRAAITEQEKQMMSDKARESKELRDAVRAFSEAAEDINKNTPKTTYTNCYRSFDNSVNCTSTTP